MTEMLVLPFYVVVDVSYSMTVQPPMLDGVASKTPLEAGNEIVQKVRVALDLTPLLGDKVRFSLLDFSDDAQVVIPMCDLTKVPVGDIPTLTARGGTSYAAAFQLLQHQIPIDVAQMKAEGHKVHRPAVFFLTDGEPTDADAIWKSAFADLVSPSFKERPNFIPFGVAEAKKEILDQLVYPTNRMRSFVQRAGADPADAIATMAEKLVSSIIASASSIQSDGMGGTFVLPDDDEDEGLWL